MRILQVVQSMDPSTGGVSQGIRNNIPAMEKLGVITEVVSLDSPELDFIKSDPNTIHGLGPAPGPYSYSSKLQKWLLSNFRRFDVVIINGLWRYHSFGTFLALQKINRKYRRRVKFFIMPHGMLDPYFQKAKDRKLKALRNYFFWKLIENRVINAADGLLFTCDQELTLAREPFSPYRPKAEKNVGYGIQAPPPFEEKFDMAFFEKCPAVKSKPYLLFLSRIHPKKGIDILLEAYSHFKADTSNIPQLVVAGPGLESPFGKMLLKKYNHNSIHFTGMLQGDAKWGAFYNSEAFLLPSHQENFGIAVVEALACGIPVLISRQVNIFKEIENGRGGIIGEDTEAGILKMFQNWADMDETDKADLGKNAYRVYEDNFTINTTTSRMVNVINSIISSKTITA